MNTRTCCPLCSLECVKFSSSSIRQRFLLYLFTKEWTLPARAAILNVQGHSSIQQAIKTTRLVYRLILNSLIITYGASLNGSREADISASLTAAGMDVSLLNALKDSRRRAHGSGPMMKLITLRSHFIIPVLLL